MNLPPYVTATAGRLSAVPPFDFDGVTARVFPLRADPLCLERFCDRYLNLVPPEVASFRPALPYVFLMILNYPRMASEVRNDGWVGQHEVAFSVPLARFRRKEGGEVFAGWAQVFPFIFVDAGLSLITGREVFGWPKEETWLDPRVDAWASHPRDQRCLLTVGIKVFPRLYEGKKKVKRVLLEIFQEPALTFSELPPDLRNPFNPMSFVTDAAARWFSLLGDQARLWWFGPWRSPGQWPAMIGTALERLSTLDSVNLKQFRDAQEPDHACYQALTLGRSKIRKLNRGGWLGDLALWRGDTTGGYRVHLHRHDSLPLLDLLGLETRGKARAGSVAELEPVFPFWSECDFEYGTGTTLAWRTKHSGWHRGEAKPTADSESHCAPYNVVRGGSRGPMAGPFRFPDVTARVLVLQADEEKLTRFCNDYLEGPQGDPAVYQVSPDKIQHGDDSIYGVYLIALDYQGMTAETNDVGWWAEHDVGFFVPVEIKQRNKLVIDGEDERVELALVSPFFFADTWTSVITRREVSGLPAQWAEIESPPDSWLAPGGPDATRRLLRLCTDVLPALGEGQEVTRRVLLEVVSGGAPTAKSMRKPPADESTDCEPGIRPLTPLYYPLTSHHFLHLKQFRDLADPEKACYQSLVLGKTLFDLSVEHSQPQKALKELHLRLYRYQSHPIVELLGLTTRSGNPERTPGGLAVDLIEPLKAFWMRGAMTQRLDRELLRIHPPADGPACPGF